MEKQTNPSAAIEDVTVLAKDDAIDVTAGCLTDGEVQPVQPVEHAIEISVAAASSESIAAGCTVDETSG